MSTAEARPLAAAEANSLFNELWSAPALVLAISGGPDSTALMLLAAHWRATRQNGPRLVAVTVDHGLRPEAKAEAAVVARLARRLKITHRTLQWTGRKPATGLQLAARAARYRLLAEAARRAKATHILAAHTLDDQAETVLIRLARGSGVRGLGAMSRLAPVPGTADLTLARPLLEIPKARLIATLKAAKVPFAEDPSNRDPRFTRARLRTLMPVLAEEGLDARRLALLARRLRRADEALEAAATQARAALSIPVATGAIGFDATGFAGLPAEVGLRLIGAALEQVGDEGPVELGKLEALVAALAASQMGKNPRFRRTLAGAIVTLARNSLMIERAPRRRTRVLTTRERGPIKAGKPVKR